MLSKFAIAGKIKTKEQVNMIDEVIKRRLLNDGDGVGDERRIVTLLKGIQEFAVGDFPNEELDKRMAHLIGQIRQIEYSGRRTCAAVKMCEDTSKVYADVKEEIKAETAKTKEAITQAKLIIEEETKHRKHSMEYEALSKLIDSKPDRKLTAAKRKALKAEVKELDAMKEELSVTVKDREKHLRSLSVALQLVRSHVDGNFEGKLPVLSSEPSTSTSDGTNPILEEPQPSPSTPGSSKEVLVPKTEPEEVAEADVEEPMEVEVSGADSDHEFSQPTEPGTSSEPSTVDGTSAVVKEKYEDLSEESPEEGESED